METIQTSYWNRDKFYHILTRVRNRKKTNISTVENSQGKVFIFHFNNWMVSVVIFRSFSFFFPLGYSLLSKA